MADYVVPPKCTVSYLGQNYEAGATVPGYKPPVEKAEKPKEADKATKKE